MGKWTNTYTPRKRNVEKFAFKQIKAQKKKNKIEVEEKKKKYVTNYS